MAEEHEPPEQEALLDMRHERQKLMCLVKWKNRPVAESTYVATYDLKDGSLGFVCVFLLLFALLSP